MRVTTMQSLRNKILSAYGYSKVVMLTFAVVMFVDLYLLDRQIQRGEVVTDFREAMLEMRRDEKNLFLYQDRTDLNLLLRQIKVARHVLAEGRVAFVAVSGEAAYGRLEAALKTYQDEVARYPFGADTGSASQHAIRKLGQTLNAASLDVSRREREVLTEATRDARQMLMVAFAGVVLLGVGGGLFLLHRVVRPLRKLEEGLRTIDEGRARELALPSQDREIRSFVDAFNAMLKHMRRQQDQTKRNEKAAALGVLVSGVAHELNNPLSNISSSAQLLLEEGDNADAQTKRLWLTQIDSETERSRRIVRRLLDSVRQPKLQWQRMPLDELVQSALILVNRQLSPKVQVCVGAVAGIEVQVDRERLQQLFINLIKNAAEAGAEHISVSAHPAVWDDELAEAGHLEGDPAMLRQAARVLRIAVEDDGPGIPAEVCKHIFDPFFTTRTAGEGTGLGLYLVEEIVSEHHGAILVDAPVAGGTRFSVWLPMFEEPLIYSAVPLAQGYADVSQTRKCLRNGEKQK